MNGGKEVRHLLKATFVGSKAGSYAGHNLESVRKEERKSQGFDLGCFFDSGDPVAFSNVRYLKKRFYE